METSWKTTMSKGSIIASQLRYILMHLRSCMYAVIKGLSTYRHVVKCTYLIQGTFQNEPNKTEWRCLIYGLQQNVTNYKGISLLYCPNTGTETMECYKMDYKLIYSPTIRNVLIRYFNWISAFCFFLVFSLPV